MSINKAIIEGNLGKDPELRYTPTGSAVCSFSVATTETWDSKDGQKNERTDWHQVVVWGKLAENCNKYLKKGSKVLVEGSIRYETYQDKKTGDTRYSTKINATVVNFLSSSKRSTDNQQNNEDSGEEQSNNEPNYASDNIDY